MTEESLEARCRACQELLDDDDKRAAGFETKFPGCACDQVSISEHSPGRVEDPEALARLVLEPKHIGKDGTIEVGALRDAHGNGLSLVRRKWAGDEELLRRGEELVALLQQREDAKAARDERVPDKISLAGAVDFQAGAVRDYPVDGVRRFCVMDSASKEDKYHADITLTASKKSEFSRMRDELRKTLQSVTPYPLKRASNG